MRDIKFRAWYKEKNKMIYSDETYPRSIYKFGFEIFNNYKLSLSKCTDRSGRIFNVDNEGVLIFNPVDADIMQYTGLKDKNGKEIYEEDVLDYGEFGKYKVIFNKASFKIQKLDNLNGNLHLLGECFFDEIEVIGNIYENPELLK